MRQMPKICALCGTHALRGLIAADEILQAIESAGSSTKDDSKEA